MAGGWGEVVGIREILPQEEAVVSNNTLCTFCFFSGNLHLVFAHSSTSVARPSMLEDLQERKKVLHVGTNVSMESLQRYT